MDLADLVREVVDGFREEVERHGSRLSLTVSETPVIGRWDATRVEQVVANLVLNAAKFGAGKPIAITVAGDDERGRLTVTDQGLGIKPEDQARIFGRFERVEAPGGALGLGLGLFIASQIVHAHGGDIHLESTVGVGSTFTVDLPRAAFTAVRDRVAPGANLS